MGHAPSPDQKRWTTQRQRDKRDAMEAQNAEIRQAAKLVSDNLDLIIRTAESSSVHDGMARGGHQTDLDDEDADVTLTTVEAAAIAVEPVQHERDQALAVRQMHELASQLMVRAAEMTRWLADRQPKEARDTEAVTCVEWGCERLRADGWGPQNPNGSAGRCRSCYDHRRKLRIAG